MYYISIQFLYITTQIMESFGLFYKHQKRPFKLHDFFYLFVCEIELFLDLIVHKQKTVLMLNRIVEIELFICICCLPLIYYCINNLFFFCLLRLVINLLFSTATYCLCVYILYQFSIT